MPPSPGCDLGLMKRILIIVARAMECAANAIKEFLGESAAQEIDGPALALSDLGDVEPNEVIREVIVHEKKRSSTPAPQDDFFLERMIRGDGTHGAAADRAAGAIRHCIPLAIADLRPEEEGREAQGRDCARS